MPDSYWNKESDPYQYPNSSVLKNLPDIQDHKTLETFEQRATALRMDEVIATIAGQSVSLALWRTIHRLLFQDVYDWAGNIRTVQLAKGSTVFAMPEHIEAQANRIFDALQTEAWTGMEREELISRLAYYFGELNALHPFREGNGRTQKLLFDEIARRAGYEIDWAKMNTDALLRAVIAAFHKQEYAQLERLFADACHAAS